MEDDPGEWFERAVVWYQQDAAGTHRDVETAIERGESQKLIAWMQEQRAAAYYQARMMRENFQALGELK